MLSDFFYCGIVVGGAMLGIGQIVRAIPRDQETSENMRGIAVIMAAFAEGIGVLAIVLGLLAAMVQSGDTGGIAAALLVVVPVVILGVPALLMLFPMGDLVSVRAAKTLLGAYMAGLGILAVVVALVAVFSEEGDGASGFDPLVAALGIIGAIAAIGIGYVGAQAVRSRTGEDTLSGAPVDVAAIRSRAVLRGAALVAVGAGTAMVALYMALIA